MICFYCRRPLYFLGETARVSIKCKAKQTRPTVCRSCGAEYNVVIIAKTPPTKEVHPNLPAD